MVQDPRPLEVRGCRDDNADVTKHVLKNGVFMVWGRGIDMTYCCVSVFDTELVGVGV